jgi:hypothetical protein
MTPLRDYRETTEAYSSWNGGKISHLWEISSFFSHSETDKNYIKWEIFFIKIIFLNMPVMQILEM